MTTIGPCRCLEPAVFGHVHNTWSRCHRAAPSGQRPAPSTAQLDAQDRAHTILRALATARGRQEAR